mmetsp:Transcript_121191/g.328901  ORF Transcript_121191/g.328901 Transcript_121191/m.328901 type:complete len:229 (-) Transcript_121191:39-725(-)
MRVGLVLEQGLADLHVALASRHQQGRPALVAPVVRVRVGSEQRLADGGVALPGRDQQRGGAVFAESVDVRLDAEEVAHHVHAPDVARLVQRRVAVGALRVHVGAFLHQQLDHGGPAAVGRLLEKRVALWVPHLDAHPLSDQEPYALRLPALAQVVQVLEDQLELVDQLLLQSVHTCVVKAPHEQPRGPAHLYQYGWGMSGESREDLILLQDDAELRHGPPCPRWRRCP